MNYAHHTIRWVARIGYGARGLVYLVLGGLALHAAIVFSHARDVHGAMRSINEEPGGQLVLVGLAVGLIAYAIWRAVQSVLDVDRHGWSPRALAVRGGLLVSVAMHVSLAWGCIQIVRDDEGGHGQPIQHAVSRLLDWPFGPALVIVFGAAIGGAGVAHIYKAAVAGFRRWFEAPPSMMWWIDPVSRVGLIARGLLFIGVAAFVIYSAITLDPNDARGVQGVLIWIQQRLYGRVLLGVLACGLMAFGAYSVIEAFVRRVGLRQRH